VAGGSTSSPRTVKRILQILKSKFAGGRQATDYLSCLAKKEKQKKVTSCRSATGEIACFLSLTLRHSHSTKLSKDDSQVAGYQGEWLFNHLPQTSSSSPQISSQTANNPAHSAQQHDQRQIIVL
jgi:hypothetical protein